MGLDTVELVMEFEQEFQISIPDDEAERMQYIRDTIDFIVRALAAKPRFQSDGRCPTARVFRSLRIGLASEFGIPFRRIRPSSAVADLIPPGHDRTRWSEFARRHDLPIPRFSFFPSRRFPVADATIAELVRSSRRPGWYFTADGAVDVDRVTKKVCVIVSEQMGVALEEVHPALHYINDLNC